MFVHLFGAIRGAAAAAVAYLLRGTFTGANKTFGDGAVLGGTASANDIMASFDGANQAVANGETLGSGGTYPGYVEDGLMTALDTSTGSVAITNNACVITGKTSGMDWSQGLIGSGFTPVACSVWAFDITPSSASTDIYIMTGTNASSPRLNRLMDIALLSDGKLDLYQRNGVTTIVQQRTDVFSFSAGNTYRLAFVVGGHDSSGAVDATGTYGCWLFYKDVTANGPWTLGAEVAGHDNGVLQYPSYYVYRDLHTLTVDNLRVPTSALTVEAVFEPTEACICKFTGADDTIIAPGTYTPDLAGWTFSDPVIVYDESSGISPEIISNRMTNINLSKRETVVFDIGAAMSTVGVFQQAVVKAVGATTNTYSMMLPRYVDSNNGVHCYFHMGGNFLQIYTYTAAVFTLRSQTSKTFVADTDYTMTVRDSGSVTELWVNGESGNKASYTSTTHNTGQKVVLAAYSASAANRASIDNYLLLPLTSTTYDTELNQLGVYTDYVENGLLTVIESGTGTVDVTSNALRVQGDGTTANTGVTGTSFTGAAGTVYKATVTKVTAGEIMVPRIGLADASATPLANSLVQTGTLSSSGAQFLLVEDGAASTLGYYALSGEIASDSAIEYSVVTGGFDSAGVPDATGTYGARVFFNDGGAGWTLAAVDKNNNYAATLHPYVFGFDNGGAGITPFDCDNVKVPDGTTVEAVFSPTGGINCSFTGTNGTAITAYTPELGDAWTIPSAGNGAGCTGEILSNEIDVTATGTGSVFVFFNDTLSDDDCVYMFGGNFASSYTAINIKQNTAQHQLRDSILLFHSGLNANLYSVDGGGSTLRATTATSVNQADGADHVWTIRHSGGLTEAWVDGGGKVSYDFTTSYDGNTRISYEGQSASCFFNWCAVYPVTNATYNTELDAI